MLLKEVIAELERFAPLDLAEDWDNVGLLVGDDQSEVKRVMTCLTLTPNVAAEAIREQADLIVCHHPIMFRPIQRITNATSEGKMLLDLIVGNVAVYSPHTAFDSAPDGINQRIAKVLELSNIHPIRPFADQDGLGSGRYGELSQPTTMENLLEVVKQKLGVSKLQYVGNLEQPVTKVGIACGSAAEFLNDAQKHDCEVLITGEARFHALLQAESLQMGMILLGHYGSERPAVEQLAEDIAGWFPEVKAWASSDEVDPLKWSVSNE